MVSVLCKCGSKRRTGFSVHIRLSSSCIMMSVLACSGRTIHIIRLVLLLLELRFVSPVLFELHAILIWVLPLSLIYISFVIFHHPLSYLRDQLFLFLSFSLFIVCPCPIFILSCLFFSPSFLPPLSSILSTQYLLTGEFKDYRGFATAALDCVIGSPALLRRVQYILYRHTQLEGGYS